MTLWTKTSTSTTAEDMVKVVTVDDSAIVREVMALALDRLDGVELVGQAADGASALRLLSETNPDLAILDLVLPCTEGLSLVKLVRSRFPIIKVLVISASAVTAREKRDVYAAGADFALGKPYTLEDFSEAILGIMSHPSPDLRLV